MSRTRLGATSLVARHLRTGVSSSILLALLVATATFAVSLAPRAIAELGTAEIRHTIAALPPVQRDLSASGVFGAPTVQDRPPATAAETFGAFSDALDRFPAEASAPLSKVLGPAQWVVYTAAHAADPVDGRPLTVHPVITLAFDLDWSARVRLVDGTPPSAWHGQDGDGVDPSANAPIDVALSSSSAALAGLRVGDILQYSPAPLRIAALYAPKDPGDPFWAHLPDLKTGNVFQSSGGSFLLYADVFVDPESAVALRDTLTTATFAAWFPVQIERLRFADADQLNAQARQLEVGGSQLTGAQSANFTWRLPDAVTLVDKRMALVTSLLALVGSGLIGVILAVFALGVQSVIARRSTALALLRSRGGSATQVRTVSVIEGVLISVPAAVLGYLAAVAAIPGDAATSTPVLPILFAVTPPLLFAIFATRSPGARRADLRVRSRSGARWVIEVAVIGLAVVSLFLLSRRGLARTSLAVGVDPLLVATPLLLSLAACLVVLRLYPALMAAVHRAARTNRGAVGLVGAARATRTPALGFVAALALIVGISTAVFSTVLSTTVAHALETDARLSVGADIRVEAGHLDTTINDQVSALSLVRASAALQRVDDVAVEIAGVPATVTVVVGQLDALHRVRPDIPVGARTGTLPVYLSHELARDLGKTRLVVNGHSASFAGEVASNALPSVGTAWVLIDAGNTDQVENAFDPDSLLIALKPDADVDTSAAAIARVVRAGQGERDPDNVTLIQARQVLATANAEPVISGLTLAFLLAAMASALLSMLAVVLAAVSSSGARNRLIGVLRILGISPRQVTGLTVWELLPITFTAVVAGTLLGIGELWIVTTVVDLRTFLSGMVRPTPIVDPLALGLVVIAFAAVVALAGLVAVEIGRRYSPAVSIKIGAE